MVETATTLCICPVGSNLSSANSLFSTTFLSKSEIKLLLLFYHSVSSMRLDLRDKLSLLNAINQEA